jgi:hypothetical protein
MRKFLNPSSVKKAGVGIYEITFNTGPTGSKVPLDIENCAVFATPRVDHESKPGEVTRMSMSSASAARGSTSSPRSRWCTASARSCRS